MRLRGERTWIAVLALASLALMVSAAAGAPATLPDLKPLPPDDLVVAIPDQLEQGERALRFTVTTMNVGNYALELLGIPTADPMRATAMQCMSWLTRVCTERRASGELAFHEEHSHWHFEGYALYELRTLVGDDPDMGPDGLVAGGEKVSFCLQDGDAASERPPGDAPRIYRGCWGLLQGISPGWADTYDYVLPGQQIVIDAVPDGRYALVVTIDPEGRLAETLRSNNVAVRRLEIFRGGSKVIPIDDDEPVIP